MNLEGKKVVVIGGSSGIGLGIAQASAVIGATIVIASRSAQKLKAASKLIAGQVQSYAVNLADEEAVSNVMGQIGAMDHLIVSGGRSTSGPFLELASETAREDFEINFWGKYNAARYGAPNIQKGGTITFISGVYGRKPSADAVVTAASVSATDSLARALAVALAPIRVNSIAPGLINTPAIMSDATEQERKEFYDSVASYWPAGGVGQPEDIAQVALMLMTNPFMTGATIYVDGGYTIV
jgi:NAD(P)-dependent dehydrogenase (short-subunit alcohol dehydrogenase family)